MCHSGSPQLLLRRRPQQRPPRCHHSASQWLTASHNCQHAHCAAMANSTSNLGRLTPCQDCQWYSWQALRCTCLARRVTTARDESLGRHSSTAQVHCQAVAYCRAHTSWDRGVRPCACHHRRRRRSRQVAHRFQTVQGVHRASCRVHSHCSRGVHAAHTWAVGHLCTMRTASPTRLQGAGVAASMDRPQLCRPGRDPPTGRERLFRGPEDVRPALYRQGGHV